MANQIPGGIQSSDSSDTISLLLEIIFGVFGHFGGRAPPLCREVLARPGWPRKKGCRIRRLIFPYAYFRV